MSPTPNQELKYPLPSLSTVEPDTSSVDSMSELAYLVIRDQIVTAKLAPGSVLEEKGLADWLGLGRTPVREALSLLTNEMLVTTMLRRGRVVSEISVADVRYIYEVREIMEGPAVRLAVERASASDRLRAERYVADLEQLAGGEFDDRDLIALDYRCHSFVYRCTKNRFFERTLVRYLNQATRLWYVYLDAIAYARSDDDQRRPIEDLKTLLTALAAGDAEAAATVAQTHVRRSHSAVIGPLVPDARLNAVQ